MSRAQLLIPILLLGACAGETKTPASQSDGGAVVYYDTGYTPPPPGQEAGVTPTYDTGVSSGSASCTDIYACIWNSDCQDQTCYQTCIAKGSAAAQQQYQAVDQCEQAAWGVTCSTCNDQTFDATCASCLDSTCGQQYTACGMTLSCEQGYSCMDTCAESDDACYEACYSKLTATGMAQFLAAETCWETAVQGTCAASCTDQQSQQCYTCTDGQCGTEFQACGLI